MSEAQDRFRLDAVVLDDSIGRSTPDVEHERAAAIFDLIEENVFEPIGHDGGPYHLSLALVDSKLVFSVTTVDRQDVATHILSLTPLRRIIKDYFLILDSYYDAIRAATPSRIEAIDMGRRGIHNEGSQMLMERLEDKIRVDFDSARRLFTLICVLYRSA